MEKGEENMKDQNNKYIATIGLEIHSELKTASKMFCSCRNNPDEEKPNINICPICMGHPGTLPVLNKEAIKHVLKIGYAVDGNIADFTEWDRKNYFYPDIPKGYQISQYKYPLVSGGKLACVELTRIHLEEDTAQSTHDIHKKSLINFNRSGVPLMELVTEPVIHDAETAVKFAKELKTLLRYIGAGEANLEKGEMRIEANISVATIENTKAKKFGVKTEVKNLNSFKAVEKAISFEIERQIKIIENCEKVVQETRGWDDSVGETYSQRLKESSHDYRYFPEPDIPKLKISEIEEFKKENLMKDIPELPWIKRERYIKDFGMTEKEVSIFIDQREVGEYFEGVIKSFDKDKKEKISEDKNSKLIKLTVNYILSDYLGLLKKEEEKNKKENVSGRNDKKEGGKENIKIEKIDAKNFAKLMTMIGEGKLSSRGGKDTLVILIKENSDPEMIAEKNGLIQKSDEGEIKKICEEIVKNNSSVVDDYKKGKVAVLQFLVGQGMKATKGSANPELLKKLILQVINN